MDEKEYMKSVIVKMQQKAAELQAEGKKEEAIECNMIGRWLFELKMLQDSMRCKFAVSMANGFLSESNGRFDSPDILADKAVECADALIERLKKSV